MRPAGPTGGGDRLGVPEPVRGLSPGQVAGGSSPALDPTRPHGDASAAGSPPDIEARRPGSPLTIGVITSGNAGSFASAAGLDVNFGDQRKQAQVIAGYLNDNGGILGRRISLVFYDFDTAQSPDVNSQAACTAFTQDHRAFAATGVAAMTDAYHQCAQQRNMVVLSDGDFKATSFFRRFRTTILISDLDLTRKYAAMVNALHEQRFFTPGAKIALIYQDERNDIEGIRNGMKPALTRLGLRVEDEALVSATDNGQYAAAMSSSVLRFRSEGITHVLFGFAAAWLWAKTAEQQSYFPHLGIESRQSPGLLMQTVNSARSLENAYGIGYQPIQDVDAARDPGFVSPGQKLCKKLLDDAGQGWGSNRLAAATALYLCDQLFFLRDAMRGQREVTPAALLQGVAGLGSSYRSPLTFSTAFSAVRHDGADAYRLLRFRSQCSCFAYVSSSRPFRS